MLPDGTVLATGGSRNSDVTDRANAVLAAELWDPTAETWSTLSSGVVPRLYHSSAILLPDGRVALAGGGHPPGFGVDEYRSEIFSPPYLFKGARPTITSAPSQANYGQSFFVATPDGATITKVALIPQPAVTHAMNNHPAYIPLTFSQTAGGLTVTAPPNGNIAPPGNYMLFLLNSNGVPSVASWVRFTASGGGASLPQVAGSPGRDRTPVTTNESGPAAVTSPSTFWPLFSGTRFDARSGEASSLASSPTQALCRLPAAEKSTRGPPKRGPP